jgi:outer membrane protein TolC
MSNTFKQTLLRQAVIVAIGGLMAGCSFTPEYKLPDTHTAAGYQETQDASVSKLPWKQATPEKVAQAHWEEFNLPELPELMARMEKSNASLEQSKQTYEAAAALIGEASSQLFPTVSGSGTANRSKSSTSVSNTRGFGLSSSWELDIWGSQRNTVKADEASAKASADDVAAERLSLQAELVQALLSWRTVSVEKQLLDASVADYEQYLKLVQAQVQYGTASAADVASAEEQLRSAKVTASDLDISRKQYEHAIALLVGETPATFQMPKVAGIQGNLRAPVDFAGKGQGVSGDVHADISAVLPVLPVVPLSTPSELLQRRPDIAAAERRVAAANYEIGVANAAFFPSISLTGTFGQSSTGASLFSSAAKYWSLGPSLTMPLFEAGLLEAGKKQYVAQWKEASATYRQTVLAAIQEVEDDLSSLNTLGTEYQDEEKAVLAARKTAELTLAQYKEGTATGLQVIAANASLLNAENTEVALYARRLTSAVSLTSAMGGGWQDKS